MTGASLPGLFQESVPRRAARPSVASWRCLLSPRCQTRSGRARGARRLQDPRYGGSPGSSSRLQAQPAQCSRRCWPRRSVLETALSLYLRPYRRLAGGDRPGSARAVLYRSGPPSGWPPRCLSPNHENHPLEQPPVMEPDPDRLAREAHYPDSAFRGALRSGTCTALPHRCAVLRPVYRRTCCVPRAADNAARLAALRGSGRGAVHGGSAAS